MLTKIDAEIIALSEKREKTNACFVYKALFLWTRVGVSNFFNVDKNKYSSLHMLIDKKKSQKVNACHGMCNVHCAFR
jgi:hypothetical protein